MLRASANSPQLGEALLRFQSWKSYGAFQGASFPDGHATGGGWMAGASSTHYNERRRDGHVTYVVFSYGTVIGWYDDERGWNVDGHIHSATSGRHLHHLRTMLRNTPYRLWSKQNSLSHAQLSALAQVGARHAGLRADKLRKSTLAALVRAKVVNVEYGANGSQWVSLTRRGNVVLNDGFITING
jgi:hypothetical protein